MRYPPLPPVIQGLAGPIRVDRPLVVDPSCPTNVGLWLWDERRILVKSTIKRPSSWHIFLHEVMHAAVEDGGIHGLTYNKEEQLCEVAASAYSHVIRTLLRDQASR